MYLTALASLHPSPTDTCSMYLNLATLAALPVKCSRHNAPSHAHAISKIVKSTTVGTDESIVVWYPLLQCHIIYQLVKLFSETCLQQNHKGLELFPFSGRFCLIEALAI